MKQKGTQYAEHLLSIIRKEMGRQSVGALIVPTADPHNSEYVAERFQHRAKLTNFYGSAGTAVVTLNEALLWTDGRYWMEAESDMPSNWQIVKIGTPGAPTIEEWLEKKQLAAEKDIACGKFIVGTDPTTTDVRSWELMAKKITLKPSKIVPDAVAKSNVDSSSDEANACTKSKVFVRDQEYCGATPTNKLEQILSKVTKDYPTVDALLLTALDDIAWLTNMRGLDDVPYNPVFISYLIVSIRDKQMHLFVDLDEEFKDCNTTSNSRTPIRAHCQSHNIVLHPYESIDTFISERYLSSSDDKKKAVIGIEERQTNFALVDRIEGGGGQGTSIQTATALRVSSIVSHLKGTKNAVELKGFEDCHIRDGCALVRFMAWLSAEMKEENPKNIHEVDCSDKVTWFRSQEQLFRGPSFATISSSGPNGAVIHYSPKTGTDRRLNKAELYLVDSGGQYEDGTTDVTRVLTFDPRLLKKSTPSLVDEEVDHIRTAYTLVLQGHIALAAAVFPEGVAGYRLDVLARLPLWKQGLDYAHGTGHGVGSFLCVHEGPHSVPSRLPATSVPLIEGMILSNEPGYYEANHFGIRIENLVSVVKADVSKLRFASGTTVAPTTTDCKSLAFKQLTMVPFNKDLIDVSMLTAEERAFVDTYHQEVRRALTPLIEKHGDTVALDYLNANTEPL